MSEYLNRLDPVNQPYIFDLDDNNIIFVDDPLQCYANGNPPPTYVWQQLNGTFPVRNISGPLLPASLLQNNSIWRCTVSNLIGGNVTKKSITTGPLLICKFTAGNCMYNLHITA